MGKLLIRWGINAIALWAAIQIVPGLDHDGTGVSLLMIALIFGLVNALVRPFLLLLTCPLVLLTLGVFLLVINTVMLSLTIWISSLFDLGMSSSGFWATFFGALVISIVSGVINLLIKDDDERETRVTIIRH
ncbi:MAG: phage holin family protein [Chloroflexi bacterium]|nr:MAG: phage holin family protein [Chloroflexota bacterium]